MPGEREEEVTAGVRDAGAHPAEPIAGDTVLERRRGLDRQILVGAADRADRDQLRLRVGARPEQHDGERQSGQYRPGT